MYDPAAVSGVPESWLDILKPEYKGKVAMVDDPLGNLLIWGTVVTGKPMGTILTKAEMAQVIDKLIDIKKNHARALRNFQGAESTPRACHMCDIDHIFQGSRWF